MKQFYTVESLAERMGVSKAVIYSLLKRGRIQAYRIGRRLRFSQDQVDDYLEQVVVDNGTSDE